MKLNERISGIRMILSDVDGVLTNGAITFNNQGIESKTFHARDGLGIKLWQQTGCPFGIITARSSHIVKVRMNELGVEIVRQGSKNKLTVASKLVEEHGIELEEVCYIGDDLTDLPLLKKVGLAASIADGVEEVRNVAHLVTDASGGSGAVRELIETILKAQHKWNEAIESYSNQL